MPRTPVKSPIIRVRPTRRGAGSVARPKSPLPLGEGQGEGATRPSTTSPSPLTVTDRDRTLVAPELKAFIAGLRDESARASYAAVLASLESGTVEGEALERLGAFLELALTTGRARHRLGPQGEESLRRFYERTPRGAAGKASAAAVTEALAPLVGGTLRGLNLDLVRPGTYRLVMETDQYRVQIGLAPAGAHVESIEVAL